MIRSISYNRYFSTATAQASGTPFGAGPAPPDEYRPHHQHPGGHPENKAHPAGAAEPALMREEPVIGVRDPRRRERVGDPAGDCGTSLELPRHPAQRDHGQ